LKVEFATPVSDQAAGTDLAASAGNRLVTEDSAN
jgi:hypothetical protein